MDPTAYLVLACARFLALHVLLSTPLRAALVGVVAIVVALTRKKQE